VTLCPRFAKRAAQASPAIPAPITTIFFGDVVTR
jgi:hypothetical protein